MAQPADRLGDRGRALLPGAHGAARPARIVAGGRLLDAQHAGGDRGADGTALPALRPHLGGVRVAGAAGLRRAEAAAVVGLRAGRRRGDGRLPVALLLRVRDQRRGAVRGVAAVAARTAQAAGHHGRRPRRGRRLDRPQPLVLERLPAPELRPGQEADARGHARAFARGAAAPDGVLRLARRLGAGRIQAVPARDPPGDRRCRADVVRAARAAASWPSPCCLRCRARGARSSPI